LRNEVEIPAREAAAEKAVLLKEKEMGLWLRYQRMHDSMFHRAHNSLERPEAPAPEADADEPVSPAADRPVPEPAPAPLAQGESPHSDPQGDSGGQPREDSERQAKRVAAVEPVVPGPGAQIDSGAAGTTPPSPTAGSGASPAPDSPDETEAGR